MSNQVFASLLSIMPSLVVSTLFLVVVAIWSRGRVRTLGVVAGAVMLVVGVLTGIFQVMLPSLLDRFELPVAAASIGFLVLNLIGYVSTGLIAAGLVIGGRAQARATTPTWSQGAYSPQTDGGPPAGSGGGSDPVDLR